MLLQVSHLGYEHVSANLQPYCNISCSLIMVSF